MRFQERKPDSSLGGKCAYKGIFEGEVPNRAYSVLLLDAGASIIHLLRGLHKVWDGLITENPGLHFWSPGKKSFCLPVYLTGSGSTIAGGNFGQPKQRTQHDPAVSFTKDHFYYFNPQASARRNHYGTMYKESQQTLLFHFY